MNRTSDDVPEVYTFSGLQIASDRREPLPEVAIGEGPEREFEGLQHSQAEGEEVADGKEVAVLVSSYLKRKWKWLIIIAAIVVIATVGGSVGGTLEHRSSSTEQSSNHSMPPTLSGPPSSPPTLLPQPKYKLMQNTSIAATYCPNGDRWVFMQDDGGNIQAAQYLHSVSLWNITSSHYNFTNAILGTALSATCVNTLDLNASCHANYGLPLGQYVSVIYLNYSNALQQSIYGGGSWSDSPVFPAELTPLYGTKLSASTVNIPIYDLSDDVSECPSFSSVAVYQSTNRSLVAINISPQNNIAYDPHVNPNLFTRLSDDLFNGQNYEKLGFSCTCNDPYLSTISRYSTYCMLGGVKFGGDSEINILGEYNLHNQTLQSLQSTNGSASIPQPAGEYSSEYEALFGSDISLVQVPNNVSAVYLHSNKTIALAIGGIPNNEAVFSPASINSQTVVPFEHLSATLCGTTPNSTTICIYYQVNETTFAELSFHVASLTFGSTNHISIPYLNATH